MKPKFHIILGLLAIGLLFAACGQSTGTGDGTQGGGAEPTFTQPPPPTSTFTPTLEPTFTPTATNTNTPEPTPVPGEVVIPLEDIAASIPWLPLDESQRPTSSYYGFNVYTPPFDDPLVRQAFAAAVDRTVVAEMALRFQYANARPATTITPPAVLGRDLYNQVGIPFDPARAKELFNQAGYTDPSTFPPVTLLVSTRGEQAPGAYFRYAEEVTARWAEYLDVTVDIKVVANFGDFRQMLNDGEFDIYHLAWGADINDPDNFMRDLFHSSSEFNFGSFNDPEFDRLVTQAASLTAPWERQLLYIQAERILCETLDGVIPLYHSGFYIGG